MNRKKQADAQIHRRILYGQKPVRKLRRAVSETQTEMQKERFRLKDRQEKGDRYPEKQTEKWKRGGKNPPDGKTESWIVLITL